MVGVYGGGAFVLMFLACIALIGAPVMLAETLIGRRARQSPANALKVLALEAGHSPKWSWGAFAGMITALLILSFYSVVGGWSLDYIIDMGRGDFQGMAPDQVGAYFGDVISDPLRLTLWHTVFMLLSAVVIAKGVVEGLERSLRVMMPLLFVMIVVLLGYSMTTGHFMEGLHFMFDFKPENVMDGLLPAMVHAFFLPERGRRFDHDLRCLHAPECFHDQDGVRCRAAGHLRVADGGRGIVSDCVRGRPEPQRGTGPDVCQLALRLRQHGVRPGDGRDFFRPGRHRGLELGDFPAGAHGGLPG
jgi:hypothetical protein